MKQQDLEVFEKVVGQMESLYDELSVLSKKAPNDAVNVFKLRFVNTLLSEANHLLGKVYRPFADFDSFDQDNVPQNSDVVFILSQYLQCFEKMRADNVVPQHGYWYWAIEAKGTAEADERGLIYVRTVRPKKLRE